MEDIRQQREEAAQRLDIFKDLVIQTSDSGLVPKQDINELKQVVLHINNKKDILDEDYNDFTSLEEFLAYVNQCIDQFETSEFSELIKDLQMQYDSLQEFG